MHLLLLTLSLAQSAQFTCERMEKEYQNVYQHVDLSCAEHSECVLGYYRWDPCAFDAVAKEQKVQNLLQTRTQMHQLCAYSPKTCERVSMPVYCVNKKCTTREELKQRYTHLRFRVPQSSTGKVVLSKDTGIRCATAPCPSTANVYQTTIQNHQFTAPLSLFLDEGRPIYSWWILNDQHMIQTAPSTWLKNPSSEIELRYTLNQQ